MNNIKLYRKRSGLTQKEFAEKMGVTQSSASQWENGSRQPMLETLYRIAEVLNVPASSLIDDEKNNTPVEETKVSSTKIPPEHHKVPIVGSVACSWGEGFIDEFDGEFAFINDHLYNKYGDLVRATVARGNSMKEMINPGDLLIVVPASDIENEDIVIAMVGDDELTAKKFHYNDNGGFDLIPVNPSFGRQSYNAEEIRLLPVNIIARVVEIRKGLRM